MNRTAILASILTVVLLVVIGAYIALGIPRAAAPVTSATLACANRKTVQAAYTDASVMLTLSDGRTLTLPQVVSGSGIRYEGVVEGVNTAFISKGSDAFLTEGTLTTYENCVVNADAAEPTDGMRTFTDTGNTFTLRYPEEFTLSGAGPGYTTDWMVNATTSGMVLAQITVPKSFAPKTNFSEAKVTVGTSADPSAVATCLTSASSGEEVSATTTATLGGTTYTVLHTNDAGAGNFYETTSYRTVRAGQCYAIEYTIHSTNIGNYSPDQGITAFDHRAVEAALNGIVESVRFLN